MSDGLAEARHERLRLAADVKRTFRTKTGKLVLGYLMARYYDADLFSTDPIEMAAAVARREVIQDLKELMELHDAQT